MGEPAKIRKLRQNKRKIKQKSFLAKKKYSSGPKKKRWQKILERGGEDPKLLTFYRRF